MPVDKKVIKTENIWNNMPYCYSDRPGFASTEPILEIGDAVTLSGWTKPVTGVVKEIGIRAGVQESIWVDVPTVAVPGRYAVVGRHRVEKIERGLSIWSRTDTTCVIVDKMVAIAKTTNFQYTIFLAHKLAAKADFLNALSAATMLTRVEPSELAAYILDNPGCTDICILPPEQSVQERELWKEKEEKFKRAIYLFHVNFPILGFPAALDAAVMTAGIRQDELADYIEANPGCSEYCLLESRPKDYKGE